ncbi:uncharacterized protein PV06_05526 [Exophiala oligosperma]|uniref:Uncharacterized protein n=1 Tax=Exophiala oligosperma TaxID=215243 RepID=A0A0D2E2A2_9EURO|nr:uncharacterized protein PV06_05526 [Exophiala oligosperma]KIW41929.1 hypothetical protein PV06_05526 [Exophiala oligosperma]
MAVGATVPFVSSPLSSPPPNQSFSKTISTTSTGPTYRTAAEFPFELSQHVQTYYEERLFTQAYNFLISIVSNSVSHADPLKPVTIPPSPHLALAATISVHPVFTTRTYSREKWDQANSALRLLRLVSSLAGPINADFPTAFGFHRYDSRNSRHTSTTRYDDDDEEYHSDNHSVTSTDLNTPYASSQSLFTCCEDFWHLVGWALNCSSLAMPSTVHASRWAHYNSLLTFLIDLLERDWSLRTGGPSSTPEESLLWNYIELASGGHAKARRILRAIFADGSTRPMSEFRPIFAHELKPPTKQDTKTVAKREDVDIDADIYGDYLMRDESELSDDDNASTATGTTASGRPAKRLRRAGSRPHTPSAKVTPKTSAGSLRNDYQDGADNTNVACLGDIEALNLRMRLLRLLTYVSEHPTLTATSPTTFPDMEELLTLFVEFIKPLPLSVFAGIILTAPSTEPNSHGVSRMQSQVFDPQTEALLCESLLQRILENCAPSIRSDVLLSQQKLTEEYLPFAAGKNTVDANARVSLLLEALTRSLAQLGELKREDDLTAAVYRGIKKRMSKVVDSFEGKRPRKGENRSDEAWILLVESGDRMGRIVDGLQAE